MGTRLQVVPPAPQGFVVPSLTMPLFDLEVRRLSPGVGPLTAEDRLMLITATYEPYRETIVTNYSLAPPTQYAVLARKRWRGMWEHA